MVKKSQPITDREKEERETRPWEDYFCNISFKMLPINRSGLERFALAWCDAARNDPNYINIWTFPVLTKGLHEKTVHDWMARNPDVKNAHSFVKSLCKLRRDNGAATKLLDASWIAKTMPMYCDDYKTLEEWRAQLSAKLEQPPTKIVVEMPSFEKRPTIEEVVRKARKSMMIKHTKK